MKKVWSLICFYRRRRRSKKADGTTDTNKVVVAVIAFILTVCVFITIGDWTVKTFIVLWII